MRPEETRTGPLKNDFDGLSPDRWVKQKFSDWLVDLSLPERVALNSYTSGDSGRTLQMGPARITTAVNVRAVLDLYSPGSATSAYVRLRFVVSAS